MSGKLYLVPTPVGNLEDMSPRAIDTLKKCELILAEDTRTSAVLMKHFGINTPMISHHKFNEHSTVDSVVEKLKGGAIISLVSDAGTPAISDPGFMLSRAFSAVSIVTFKCSKNSGLAYMFSNAAEKQVVKKSMFVYIVMIFTIMLFINSLLAIITILLTILCFVKYKKMSYNEFGGITGDLAGYFLQMLELILLIAVVIFGGTS